MKAKIEGIAILLKNYCFGCKSRSAKSWMQQVLLSFHILSKNMHGVFKLWLFHNFFCFHLVLIPLKCNLCVDSRNNGFEHLFCLSSYFLFLLIHSNSTSLPPCTGNSNLKKEKLILCVLCEREWSTLDLEKSAQSCAIIAFLGAIFSQIQDVLLGNRLKLNYTDPTGVKSLKFAHHKDWVLYQAPAKPCIDL